jgi:DNA-binding NtrC family response regulator
MKVLILDKGRINVDVKNELINLGLDAKTVNVETLTDETDLSKSKRFDMIFWNLSSSSLPVADLIKEKSKISDKHTIMIHTDFMTIKNVKDSIKLGVQQYNLLRKFKLSA